MTAGGSGSLPQRCTHLARNFRIPGGKEEPQHLAPYRVVTGGLRCCSKGRGPAQLWVSKRCRREPHMQHAWSRLHPAKLDTSFKPVRPTAADSVIQQALIPARLLAVNARKAETSRHQRLPHLARQADARGTAVRWVNDTQRCQLLQLCQLQNPALCWTPQTLQVEVLQAGAAADQAMQVLQARRSGCWFWVCVRLSAL